MTRIAPSCAPIACWLVPAPRRAALGSAGQGGATLSRRRFRSAQPLAQTYDHHRYGPFLGVSDDGDSAEAIRRAACDSPKARCARPRQGRAPHRRRGARCRTAWRSRRGAVGPDEFADIWRECVDRTLMTTNIGGRAHLWLYRLTPVVTIADGDSDAALTSGKGRTCRSLQAVSQDAGRQGPAC